MIVTQGAVIVADGTQARLFVNTGNKRAPKLVQREFLTPQDLEHEGPSGSRPAEQSEKATDEATFAKQLAHVLYKRAQRGDFAELVLIADPQTLGQLRPQLHKEVTSRLVAEIGKTLTGSPIADIERAITPE